MPSAESTPFFHALRIQDLRVHVRLGCLEDERATPQEVRLTVEIRFPQAPLGEATDELADTLDYGQLSAQLKRHVEQTEFRLIERIGRDCLDIGRRLAGPSDQVGVKVHKLHPPVEGLLGGAVYACGDFSIP